MGWDGILTARTLAQTNKRNHFVPSFLLSFLLSFTTLIHFLFISPLSIAHILQHHHPLTTCTDTLSRHGTTRYDSPLPTYPSIPTQLTYTLNIMETTTVQPPRQRLFELKSSAEFSSAEFSHSIKTWVNMASLLIKQVGSIQLLRSTTATSKESSHQCHIFHLILTHYRATWQNLIRTTRTPTSHTFEHVCKCGHVIYLSYIVECSL